MKHPKGLYLLNFVSMWECFSYYGMMALMVLYLTSEWGYSDSSAFALYALYIACVEFGGLLGGYCADRFLGLTRSIQLGGWTIALGHLCIAIGGHERSFILGLALIIAGTAFFRGNVVALVGSLYRSDDTQLNAGYTLYYMGINLGSFLASLLCGIIAKIWGWHAGFGVAAIGMLLGNIAFFLDKKFFILERKGGDGMVCCAAEQKKESKILWRWLAGIGVIAGTTQLAAWGLTYVETAKAFLPGIELCLLLFAFLKIGQKGGMKVIAALAWATMTIILFYGCEELLGSSLVLFAERHLDRTTFLGIFPSAGLIMFNPLTIIVAGLILSYWPSRSPRSERESLAIGFLALAGAFFILATSPFFSSEEGLVPLGLAVLSIVLIGFGEIWVGSTVYSMIAKAAPQGSQGIAMGILTMGFSLANFFSGVLSQSMALEGGEDSLSLYAKGFTRIAILAACVFLGIYLINKKWRKYNANPVCK